MTYEEFKEWLAKGKTRAPSLYAPFENQIDQKSKGAMGEVEGDWDGREE